MGNKKHTVQRLVLSKGAKRTKFHHIMVILQYLLGKKRLHGVETCIGMIQVYLVWSFNVSESQTLRYKVSLFEFPLLQLYRSVCGTKSFF